MRKIIKESKNFIIEAETDYSDYGGFGRDYYVIEGKDSKGKFRYFEVEVKGDKENLYWLMNLLNNA